MVVKSKHSQRETEDKFSQCSNFSMKTVGWIEVKKHQKKWTINLIKGKGNPHQVNIRWDCLIKDQEIMIKRIKTFDQVIQMILGIVFSSGGILPVIGFIMRLVRAAKLNLEINPMIAIGIVFYSMLVLVFWMLYYFNFYRKIDESLELILEKVLGNP